ncbi:hypothetical protein V1264_014864 [Littorina saxatilis]|uniref:Protein O-mannose kinase n=2 Tax=Littorina saxatilis TaxID=31220 RepID=A0AAN9BTR0_9CAEN
MKSCHPLLDCRQIRENVTIKDTFGQGAVKLVRRGVWQNHQVAVNTLKNSSYIEDFSHGLHMLRQLPPTVNVTQLVGVCELDHIFVTEFHPLGSADQLESVLQREDLRRLDTLAVRFSLCEQYVKILHSLHTLPEGARVMCDSNFLEKTLSQFLLRDDLSLALNDVDALPLVDRTHGHLVKCGHRELFGEFVAPEQLWPYEDREFSDAEMPGYDEKVDIWKVPDVCEAFLNGVEGGAKIRLQLLSAHLQCKSDKPSDRLSALELLKAYESVREKLKLT